MSEHKVRCDICKEDFRATTSHINLICKECQDKEKQELIEKFIADLKNKQYFWKVYRNQLIEKWEGKKE